MKGEVAGRIIEVIRKSQHLPDGKVTAESTFAELNIDSLDGLQIVFSLEEEFGVTIPDDAARKFTTVQQAIDGVEQLLQRSEVAVAEPK